MKYIQHLYSMHASMVYNILTTLPFPRNLLIHFHFQNTKNIVPIYNANFSVLF